MKRGLFLLLCIGVAQRVAPQWLPQSSGTTARLRGVNAVSATVAWASGSDGVYLRTTDGGANWQGAAGHRAATPPFRGRRGVERATRPLTPPLRRGRPRTH